ncbi:MAG: F0F1 ATP synthase subunit A [Erysipelotrichaceae bacterium]|nr:F0F1 ATP synthase subunit A [Erysipelotrichaceae bacterium]
MTIIYGVILDYFANKAKPELIVSLLVMLIIAILAIILGQSIKKADPTKPTKGLAFIAEFIVESVDKQIANTLGNVYHKFSSYLLFLYSYIPLSFFASLFGLPSPLTYFTIPLCLALVSWIGIQLSAIHYQKLDYLKGFTSPLPTWLPVFVPINILSKLSPLLSLSIRLFGNAVAGYILMWLVYWGTSMLSEAIIGIAGLNIFGVAIAPILHAYFDIFGAFIQTLIFTTLTMLLISVEIPAPVNIDLSKKNKSKKNKELQNSKKC